MPPTAQWFGNDEARIHRRLERERFVLPVGASFYEQRNEANIGERINIALEAIEDANRAKLDSVFRNIDFNSEANLGRTKDRNGRLRNLLEAFAKPALDLHPSQVSGDITQVGCGHTLPILVPAKDGFDSEGAVCLLANLNNFGFDYVARQKVQATYLTWYIVEQLPVIDLADYDRPFGPTTARDLGLDYDSPPFVWDDDERRHLRARLDALYFHLYGLSRDDAGYVLNTFPIVRREDEKAFGRYRTRDMILTYMNALAAGDSETVVTV